MKFEFKCPACGAKPMKHGAGLSSKCKARIQLYRECEGLLCFCEKSKSHGKDVLHGKTFLVPCLTARCDHCGWAGSLPHVPTDREVQPWEVEALKAGWTPPGHRIRSLGLAGHGGSRWGSKGGTKP